MHQLRVGLAFILVLLCVLLTFGCTSINTNKTTGNLKILIFMNKSAFKQIYGDRLAKEYPNIKLELISQEGKMNNDLYSLIEETKPDIVELLPEEYRNLVSQGKLEELDPFIQRDHFEIDQMLPSLIEYLRIEDKGNLYGLAPNVRSTALFYNKELFDRYKVPYPKGNMTWEQFLSLAERFPVEGDEINRIYGWSQGLSEEPFALANYIASLQGITMVDGKNKKITIDTPEWKEIFKVSINALQSKVVYINKHDDQTGASTDKWVRGQNLFLTGRSAMTIEDNGFFELMDMLGKDKAPNWDVAEMPNLEGYPNNNGMSVRSIFSINKDSTKKDAAWTALSFINGKKIAENEARYTPAILSWPSVMKERKGRSTEPFYKLKPATESYGSKLLSIPTEFQEKFNEKLTNEVEKVKAGQQSWDEAFKKLQETGQPMLDEVYNNPKQPEQTQNQKGLQNLKPGEKITIPLTPSK